MVATGRVGARIEGLLEDKLRSARGPVGIGLGNACIEEADVVCLDCAGIVGDVPYSFVPCTSLARLRGAFCSIKEVGLDIMVGSGLFEWLEGAV